MFEMVSLRKIFLLLGASKNILHGEVWNAPCGNYFFNLFFEIVYLIAYTICFDINNLIEFVDTKEILTIECSRTTVTTLH